MMGRERGVCPVRPAYDNVYTQGEKCIYHSRRVIPGDFESDARYTMVTMFIQRGGNFLYRKFFSK